MPGWVEGIEEFRDNWVSRLMTLPSFGKSMAYMLREGELWSTGSLRFILIPIYDDINHIA